MADGTESVVLQQSNAPPRPNVPPPTQQTEAQKIQAILSPEQLKTQAQLLLLKSQNDYFFNVIGIKASGPGKGGSTVASDNKKKVKKNEKQRANDHKAELTKAKWQTRYEDRLQRLEETITELRENLPATKPQIDEYVQLRKDAREMVRDEPPRYEAAYNSLPTRKTLASVVQKGETLHGTAMEAARSKATTAMPLYDKLNEDLAKASLSPGVKEQLQAKLQEAIFLLLAPGFDILQFQEGAIRDLTAVRGTLDTAVRAAEADKKRYDELLKEAGKLDVLAKSGVGLSDQITDETIAELRRLRQNAATAYDLQEFELAKDGLEEMLNKLNALPDVTSAVDDAADDWTWAEDSIDGLVKEVNTIIATPALAPPLLMVAKNILFNLNKLKALGLSPTGKDLAEGPDKVRAAEAEIEKLKQRIAAMPDFRTDKARLCKPVDDLIIQIDTEMDGLETKLRNGGVTNQKLLEGVTNPLLQRFDTAQKRWKSVKQNAFDVISLDATGMQTTLTELQRDIASAAEDRNVTALGNSNELTRARGALNAAIDQAEDLILSVVSWDPEEGLKFREELDRIIGLSANEVVPKQLDKLTQQLNKALRTQTRNVRNTNDQVSALRQQIDEACSTVPTNLTEMEKVLNKADNNDVKKAHVALLQTLRADQESVKLLRGSNQINALTKCVADANTLREEAENGVLAAQDASRDMFSRKKSKKGVPTLESAAEELRKIAKQLKEAKTSQLYMTMTHAGLETDVKEKLSNLGSMGVNALMKEIATIKQSIVDMELKATEAKAKYEAVDGITAVIDQIKETLKNKLFTEKAPDYLKEANSQIATLLSDGQFEGNLDKALEDARKLKLEVDTMLASMPNQLGVPVLIHDKQAKAKDAKDQKEVDKTKFDSELYVLEKDLKAAKDINKKEIGALLESLAETKKSIEKSGDHATGRSELEEIRTRLALVEGNPRGLKVTARNKLPQVNQAFQAAVLQFGSTLKDLRGAIDRLDGLEPADKAVVGKVLIDLRLLFNPAAFAKTIQAMTTDGDDKAQTEKAHSAAREVGLREIRKFSNYLDTDYRLRALASTPFLKTMPPTLSKLKLTLLDLENNMLVSL